jgi:hypothetical protein
MFEIARTEELRELALKSLAHHQAELEKHPDSFASRLMVKSATSRVEELTKRLVEQKEERGFELVEIRLIGEAAQNGSLPMHMIGQLSTSFEETLVEIGKYAKYGTKKKKGVFTETRNLLGVRLKSLGSGSTRLFISIDTKPDMFGSSLSEICISRTFEVLHSKNPEDLIETSGIVGKPALRIINRFLKSLLDFKLEADLSWFTPLDTDLTWKGDKQWIQQLHDTLTELTETEPVELTIEGELITQSLKGQGKFELVSENGLTIMGTVPYDVLAYFVQVRIGSYCRVKVIQTVITNPHSGKSKSFYELREIEVISKQITPKESQLSLFSFQEKPKFQFALPEGREIVETPKQLPQLVKINQFSSGS